MRLSPLNQRRWNNFKRNRRAFWSLILFSILFAISIPAEFIANDKPIVVKYQGSYYTPIWKFYPETAFGGEFRAEAEYKEVEVQCLIISGGREDCFDDPEGVIEDAADGEIAGEQIQKGWILNPLIPYHHRTIVNKPGTAPAGPDEMNILGTDNSSRDVAALVLYGFRLSIAFTLMVTLVSSVIGILAGAVQGYFGGRVDLIFQRVLEIWAATPNLYVIIILFAILGRSFWLLVFLSILFGWPALVGVVRAEFLRARNFEYVRAARALGVSNWTIMFRHMLPNAMVATLTILPFLVTGTIGALATLDFLGFGLPSSAPSLGELTRQAKENLHTPHLAFVAFFTFATMLSLLVFIFEGVRDAFDPRKTFQ